MFCVGENPNFYYLGTNGAPILLNNAGYIAFYGFDGSHWLYIDGNNDLFEAKRSKFSV